ncbi:YhdP family protein [Photobacterium nomapromontoriensis]|uniref:YhdP family protein n=1 Tax=Photobacterium nomapromontoriensis TaxID=2910237 RepID=UPI003D0C5410
MTTVPVRLVRGVMWLVLTVLVLAAVAISGLRFILPQLNDYREPIQQWVSEQVEMNLEIAHVEGSWRNLGPSLVLQGVSVNMPDTPGSVVQVGDVSVQLDLVRSLLSVSPVFRDLRIDQMSLDLTQLNAFSPAASTSRADSQMATIRHIESLLFVQLGQFSIRDSDITLTSPAGERLTIDIQQLKWDVHNGQRRAEGIISIADTHFSQMQVIANLSDKTTWSELSGKIYVQARNLSLTPWLNKELLSDLLTDAHVTGSNLNAQVWLTVDHGQLLQSQMTLDDSFLRWQLGDDKHQLKIVNGLVNLVPLPRPDGRQGWRINTDQMVIETDQSQWPALDVAARWEPEGWQLAMNTLSLAPLQPLVSFLPPDSTAAKMLTQMQPRGLVNDIRIAATGADAPRFSFNALQLAVNQWELLPGIHKLNAQVAGSLAEGRAVLSLTDDSLPYGDVFQAPLPIRQGDVTAYWQVGDDGWRLWSDHLVVTTPHLKADGQFRLDFPADAPAWLSFYGEASANKVGETWRYLPTPALGHELTDYLSTAIRGGRAKDVKLLWYGDLETFPYAHHDGVFQAFVPIRKGMFSFDTAWPELTDLDLDLLFENDFMYLNGHHAKTMGAMASRVTGKAELIENGHLKLAIDVAADGKQVRDYMLATPLVDSVGAALTTVQVDGPVTSSFKLDIPFDSTDVRAWGSATLVDNQVMLDTPPIPLKHVSGKIHFDNDVVEAKGITASLLDQPITLDFTGNSVARGGYRVDVGLEGNWLLAALQKKLQDPLLANVSGSSQWQGNIGVNLHDIGFDYQLDLSAALANVDSQLPYPLALDAGSQQEVNLAVTGNKQSLIAKLTALDVSSQVKLNLVPDRLVIDASELAIGPVALPSMAHGVHGVSIVSDHIDGDRWIALVNEVVDKVEAQAIPGQPTIMPELPLPTRVTAKVKQLKLASLNWNHVDLYAQHQPSLWQIDLDSREATGVAQWPQGKPLKIDLSTLHLNLPVDDNAAEAAATAKYQPQSDVPPVTDFDRSMMANMPALDLQLDDAWLQGYRLGKVSGKLRRETNMLELRNFTIDSGATTLNLDGHWALHGDRSETQIAFDIEGKNSSDLMGRFGISGGIQGAEFSTYASIQWQGAPWSMHRETLTGELKSETGQGVISDIGGAGRLLGLFSIDSLIRKMQLDFSGIFDDGLAFNYIRGSGRIDNGVFETDDIKMQALAGDMFIQGSANLVNETVDAHVKFIPDFTSGIPVLTAFAVAPQTAIYVFAISTVLAPVLDVFTQVNYNVEGPIDAPVVTELSRFTGEYQVPESLKKKAKE